MQILEKVLTTMEVQHMVVPCITNVLGMWIHKFGYSPISAQEKEELEDQIIRLDPETVHLVAKELYKWVQASFQLDSRRLQTGYLCSKLSTLSPKQNPSCSRQ